MLDSQAPQTSTLRGAGFYTTIEKVQGTDLESYKPKVRYRHGRAEAFCLASQKLTMPSMANRQVALLVALIRSTCLIFCRPVCSPELLGRCFPAAFVGCCILQFSISHDAYFTPKVEEKEN
jgi:hypothetical protein